MESGLGSQATLAKIDRLRELNVGSIIPLPQLVVVGDQSSGKSSVLESLTGFSFPRAAGLCTRYATQITCYRDPVRSVNISIIPRPDANDDLKTKLLAFQRRLVELDNDELAKVFAEANSVMGIRMKAADSDVVSGSSAFSQDILKIEINGPDQVHLTVIDVPGIFRLPIEGLTTENDIVLVENMVKSYMSNSRTIILAVIPCNVDIATQEILKLAEAADPEGARTMGVLTKPDLAMETATRDAVMDLVLGRRRSLKLGYYVVKNRSADDSSSSFEERAEAEKAFFMGFPWSTARDRCGTAALKGRLRQLLPIISNQELPHVKAEISQKLSASKVELESMGPARADQMSQRLYLGRLATRFHAVAQAALNGHYMSDSIFKAEPELKLITKVVMLCEGFSNEFRERGHANGQTGESDEKDESGKTEDYFCGVLLAKATADDPVATYPELHDVILHEDYKCSEPSSDPIMPVIRKAYDSSRGLELGTFGPTILSAAFEYQTDKWPCLTLRHAIKHTEFLLTIERDRKPLTFNHYFNSNLQKKRVERVVSALEKRTTHLAPFDSEGGSEELISLSAMKDCVSNQSNEDQVCEDILDALSSYYNVAHKRFVDVVCQQVIFHFLLEADDSPLNILSPELIMGLDADQLEAIAGEDEVCKQTRQALEREVQNLEAALKVLRC